MQKLKFERYKNNQNQMPMFESKWNSLNIIEN